MVDCIIDTSLWNNYQYQHFFNTIQSVQPKKILIHNIRFSNFKGIIDTIFMDITISSDRILFKNNHLTKIECIPYDNKSPERIRGSRVDFILSNDIKNIDMSLVTGLNAIKESPIKGKNSNFT